MYAVLGLLLAVVGPGAHSVDALLGLSLLSGPTLSWTVVGFAVAVGLANVAVRRPETHEHKQDSAATSV